MASNEHPVWRSHGQEAKRGWPGGQRLPWHGEAMGRFFSRVLHRGVLERERVPERCNGLNARRMAVLWTCRAPLGVATCAVNDCATRCSILLLLTDGVSRLQTNIFIELYKL
jgi:hypothetical protein